MTKLVLAFLFIASAAIAQPTKQPVLGNLPPGRSLVEPVKKSYPDSTKFNATFHELYAAIKPASSVHERFNLQWNRMWRMFKARGLDSVVAIDTILKALDTNMDYKILYNEYRDQFSADELQEVTRFVKSPAGKKFLEAEPRLIAARTGAVDQYVRSTITNITTPMMMVKGLPQPGEPAAPMSPRPVPKPPQKTK
jgi:hypothetical protein